MTDETLTPSDQSPARAGIPPPATPTRMDRLPIFYLLGFLILAAALVWLWQHPVVPHPTPQEAARTEAMRQQLESLTARVAGLEARPAPAPPAPAPAVAPVVAAAVAPLAARLAALEARGPQPAAADLGIVQQRIDAAAAAGVEATAGVSRRLDQMETRVSAAEVSGKQAAAGLGAAADQARRAVRLQAAGAALDAGASLGAVPGAPPALARFATIAPPTVASLRLGFAAAAASAHAASQPGGGDQPFLARAWARMQQAITVRQGDKVLIGDPSTGIIEHARLLLDAGDIAGAVHTLGALPASAKAGMADWMAQARALVDARAALAELAQR